MNTGDDLAGIIESVGSRVYEFKPGDRVAAFHRLGEPHGGYAPFAIAPASTTFHLPPNISFESGAGIPLATMTAALSLYQSLGFSLPTTSDPEAKNECVLIYGGATTVGAYALQFAKLSGIGTIIAIAGRGLAYVESLNAATHIIDYRKGFVATEIVGAVKDSGYKGKLRVMDCVSAYGSYQEISLALVILGGGRIDMLDATADMDESWQFPESVGYTVTFVASAYGRKHPWTTDERTAVDEEFAYWFYRYISYLLAKRRIRPHPHVVLPDGLDGVVPALLDLKNNRISATKLVVRYAHLWKMLSRNTANCLQNRSLIIQIIIINMVNISVPQVHCPCVGREMELPHEPLRVIQISSLEFRHISSYHRS